MSSTQTSKNLTAFMAHIPFKEMQFLHEELKEEIVPNSKYLIVSETSVNGTEHFHFLCHMIPSAYARFAKRIFIDKFHLTGRATTGSPRQYGKLKKVESERRMTIYMMKDFFYNKKAKLCTNMNLSYLNQLAKLSFRKKDLKTPYKKYIVELPLYLQQHHIDFITKRTIVQAWLSICNCRPPTAKSLWWYVLKASVITDSDYIEFVYPTYERECVGVDNKYVPPKKKPNPTLDQYKDHDSLYQPVAIPTLPNL